MKAGAAIDQGSRPGNLANRQFVDLQKQLSGLALLNGVLVTGVSVVNGSFTANHGLGRKPLGYIVVNKSANVQVWNDSIGSAPSRLLYLVANGSATIDLWIF